MTLHDLLHIILERLCFSNNQQAIFCFDETREWPSDALATFVESGILQPTQDAKTIYCPGCEENCIMPVVIRTDNKNKPPWIFIVCDKRDDVGFVTIDAARLNQWQISVELLAKTLSKLLVNVQD